MVSAATEQAMSDATLRIATRADVPGIMRVRMAVRENRLERLVISDADCIEAIELSGRGWVAEVDGRIVGFAIGNHQSGNIWALFLLPEFERRGIGRRLHDVMIDWLWAQGLERLWLGTAPNTRAQAFYQAAGWQQAGVTAQGEVRFERFRPRP
jgi:GNAT superfamily N-acetyltransferase